VFSPTKINTPPRLKASKGFTIAVVLQVLTKALPPASFISERFSLRSFLTHSLYSDFVISPFANFSLQPFLS
jgi:hypothetical protein